MKTLGVIQARLGSTRLPGKVLADISGVPMLGRVIERMRAVKSIDKLVVATTTQPEDDKLVEWLTKEEVSYYRGSSEDVLDRFVQAASSHQADLIVRITADDPLKDASITECLIKKLEEDPSLDYASNTLEPTWPEGLDMEVFRVSALHRANLEAKSKTDREHVTSYIWNRPNDFKLHSLRWERNLSHWRLTVDKDSDLELVRRIFSHFGDQPLVKFSEVVEWLERNPGMLEINAGTVRNEGYLKSLKADNCK